jgi:uncharacterized protein (DUF1499 family)
MLLLGAGLFAVWALSAWPRLNDVETARTPEYPDLQARHFSASPAKVAEAARACLAELPRWRLIGSGSGPGGTELHAVHTTLVWRFDDDVYLRLRAEGGGTRASVRSRSRVGRFDFGQNARNIRELLQALDARLR